MCIGEIRKPMKICNFYSNIPSYFYENITKLFIIPKPDKKNTLTTSDGAKGKSVCTLQNLYKYTSLFRTLKQRNKIYLSYSCI